MFESLSSRLDRAFKLLKGQGRITELNVAETVRDVRRALIEADVNYKTAKEFTDRVKEKAIGQNVLTAVQPGQMLVKIMHDELTALMGGATREINLTGKPSIILIAGLQGSGKTTFSGKLALRLKSKHGLRPMLVAADVYRPAAIDQLKVLGESIGVPVYSMPGNTDAVAVAESGVRAAKSEGCNVVIVDTAGRLAVDEAMMDEITRIKRTLSPTETLFVVDSMTGQDAVNTAKTFNDRIDFDGVVLTKLDGDTRGGAALSIASVVEKPIKFVGTGEKLDALDLFHPERMADIVSLVERAQEKLDEQEALRIQQRLAKNQFDFNDFLSQLQQVKKLGNIKDLVSMIPGVGKALKDVEIDNDSFKGIEAIIHSMTPTERSNPQLLNPSRKQRIASGSGTTVSDVNRLLKQFDEMRKIMHMASKMKAGKRGGATARRR